MPYPVTFKADYVEKRSRLTTFFRLLLAIPHLIAVLFYVFAAEIVTFIAWFALLFTGRYPQGMYDFVAGALRYGTRVCGYAFLLTDEYPPFSGDPATPYPVDLNIGPPKAEYSRLKVLFRIILMIPVYIIAYAMQIVFELGALLAWFAIVVLGPPTEGPSGHDRAGDELPPARVRVLLPADRGLAALHRRDGGPHRRGRAGLRRLGLEPPGRRSRAPDLGAARRLRLARARGGLPAGGGAERARAADRRGAGGARSAARRAVGHGRALRIGRARGAPGHAGRRARARAADRARAVHPVLRRPTRRRRPSAPTSGDPLGGASPPPAPPAAAPEPPTESGPPSPGDWPDPEPEPGPPSPGDWPDPEPEAGPPTPHADDDKHEDEPPPGPFGPSSTNP